MWDVVMVEWGVRMVDQRGRWYEWVCGDGVSGCVVMV